MRPAALIAAVALWAAMPSLAHGQTPEVAPAFANAGFNAIAGSPATGEQRELLGNAFIIFARPEALNSQNPPLRRWHTVVVTARHVVEIVCGRGDGANVWLTLLPPPQSTVRALSPTELRTGAAWCRDRRADLESSQEDIFAFEAVFDLHQRALIEAYPIARSPNSASAVRVYGFVPPGYSTNPLQPTFGRGRPGLQDEPMSADYTASADHRLQFAGSQTINSGHSGSPVLDRTNNVIGILIKRGQTSGCEDAQRIYNAELGVVETSRDPAFATAAEAAAPCTDNPTVAGGLDKDRSTAYMLPVIKNAWAYLDPSLYATTTSDGQRGIPRDQSDQITAVFEIYKRYLSAPAADKRPLWDAFLAGLGRIAIHDRSERIDAALELYKASITNVPDKEELEEEFRLALNRLTVIDRVQLWSRAREQQVNAEALLNKADLNPSWMSPPQSPRP